MQTQSKQAEVVNGLIAQGMDFLLAKPNAAPSNPPTIVLHGRVSGRVILVYWDGQIGESILSAESYRAIEHWPVSAS